jgi:hypothetical protein
LVHFSLRVITAEVTAGYGPGPGRVDWPDSMSVTLRTVTVSYLRRASPWSFDRLASMGAGEAR